MPYRRHRSRIAARSSAGRVQPVGLFGELRIRARVSGVSAASSRSMSIRQRPCPASTGTTSTLLDRIFGISTTFGQIGPATTARSPGDSTS
jgi:hypothetical protein